MADKIATSYYKRWKQKEDKRHRTKLEYLYRNNYYILLVLKKLQIDIKLEWQKSFFLYYSEKLPMVLLANS